MKNNHLPTGCMFVAATLWMLLQAATVCAQSLPGQGPGRGHGSTRFVVTGNGTVIDSSAGLMWTRDANPAGKVLSWGDAKRHIKDMNSGRHPNFGHTDWRVPSSLEMQSLLGLKTASEVTPGVILGSDIVQTGRHLPSGHPFVNLPDKGDYWRSLGGLGFLLSEINYTIGSAVGLYQKYLWPVRNSARP